MEEGELVAGVFVRCAAQSFVGDGTVEVEVGFVDCMDLISSVKAHELASSVIGTYWLS